MLSYQHAYHAGGPADVHKHVALSLALQRLAEKDKPFAVVDLYAGHGVYELTGAEAQKTREFEAGIGALWPLQAAGIPASVQPFFRVLGALNPEGALARYPGSPALALHNLRTADRLILNELHPVALRDLKRWAGRDSRIAIHQRDGLEALAGLVPPPIRRGLVVVDPSYEIKSDYAAVPHSLQTAQRKWKSGIFFIWYPILADARHTALTAGIKAALSGDILACELHFDRPGKGQESPGLRGTGVVVVNPPWRLDEAMTEAGAWLAKRLTRRGRHETCWLKRA